MSFYSKVSWKEGAYLSPQHFQQLERSLEGSVQLRIQGENPLAWGLIQLQLNEAAITQGRLEVERCQAVMPDGLAVSIPDADPVPPPRAFQLPPQAERLDVYLAIPSARPRSLQVSAEPRGDVRYLETREEMPDEADPHQVDAVDLAVKNLRLVLEGEPLDGLVALRIARLSRNAEGIVIVRPDHIPPSLRVSASPALVRLARELAGQVTTRARTLAEERLQRGDELEFSAPELLAFWFLHTLNLHASVLHHLIDLPGTHPARLFEEMLRLSGSLSTFAFRADGVPPPYDHEHLTECFGAVDLRLRELLGRLFVTRYDIIPLTRKGHYWTGHIPDTELRARGQFFLAVTGELPPSEIVARMPGAAKLSGPDSIGRLVRTAVGGVRLVHIPRPPSPIPARRDATYFSLVAEGADWEEIRATGNVAAYVPAWMPGVVLELIGLRSRESVQG